MIFCLLGMASLIAKKKGEDINKWEDINLPSNQIKEIKQKSIQSTKLPTREMDTESCLEEILEKDDKTNTQYMHRIIMFLGWLRLNQHKKFPLKKTPTNYNMLRACTNLYPQLMQTRSKWTVCAALRTILRNRERHKIYETLLVALLMIGELENVPEATEFAILRMDLSCLALFLDYVVIFI